MKPRLPLFISTAVLTLALSAQTTPEVPEIPRFHLSVAVVGFDQAPGLYWRDLEYTAEGLPVISHKPLEVGLGRRGAAVEIPILEGEGVRLFRKTQAPSGGEVFLPVVDMPRREAGERIFLIFYRTETGKRGVYYLDDSLDAHPPQTVRVLNLSEANMAASIGAEGQVVQPGKDVNLGVPPVDGSGRFHYQYGASLPGGPWESPQLRLRLRGGNQRLLVLYTLMPHFENAEGGSNEIRSFRPIAYRMYDEVETGGEAATDGEP